MTGPVTALAPVTALSSALALATEAGDIHSLRDIAALASSLQKGARARGMGIDSENQAAEVVIRAERAIGGVLIAMGESGERATKGAQVRWADPEDPSSPKTYASMGLDRNASRWQALARIPEVEFESRFGTVRDSGARLAKVDFYRLVKGKPERKPEAEQEMHGDGYTPAYTLFAKAAASLVADISQLPADELLALASDIRSVVEAYNAERARR